MTVHLYALCWNEVRLLPYFFRHYDRIVDQYFIADNGSTDGSLEMLRRHPRVVLGHLAPSSSFLAMATAHYNTCWKASRGTADWVFVVNIDEHVFHRRLRGFLRACTRRGESIVVTEGYNMVATSFPTSPRPLWRTIRYGARDPNWDKPQIFAPRRLDDINFVPGRHAATPTGHVAYATGPAPKLLHFKYLGLDYLVARHHELRTRISEAEFAQGLAYQYTWDRARNLEELERHRARAVRVV
jgi:hypothetical protein